MGQGVLDQQSGTNVFYPDGVSTDTVEKSMSDFQNGAIREAKPDWYTQFIKEPLEKMGASIYDPVMSAKSLYAGLQEGVAPLTQFFNRTPQQPNSNLINIESGLQKTEKDIGQIAQPPTPYEESVYQKVAPISNFIGNMAGQLASFALLGKTNESAMNMFEKIPAVGEFINKIPALAKSALGFSAVTGEYGGLAKNEQQQEMYGNVNISDDAREAIKQGITGMMAGAVMGKFMTPLSELGMDESYTKELAKRMATSGMVMGAVTASQGGSRRDVIMSTIVGGLFPAMFFHGEIPAVRENIPNTLIDIKTAYTTSQTGGDETAVRQAMTEHTQNDAEQIIHESLAQISDLKPVAEEQRLGREKDFSDPYDPKMMNFLAQYIPPNLIVRMDGEERLWLSNLPIKELNAYAKLHAESAMGEAEGEYYRATGELVEDNVKREAGIAVDKNVLDEVASSKELTQNLLAKTANELTGSGTQIGERNPKGTTDANKGGTQTGSRGTKEGVEGQARAGIRVRDNDETGTAQAKTEGEVGNPKVAKSSQDIADQLVKRGVAELSDEDKAHFASTSFKGKTEELTDLMRTDPQTAERIATGEEQSSLSPSEKQLLFNMIKIKADEDRNFELGLKLARSPLNVERSEAAKTLGASGFNNAFEHDPYKVIRNVEESKKVDAKKSEPLLKKVRATVKSEAPKLNDWQKFIEGIKC